MSYFRRYLCLVTVPSANHDPNVRHMVHSKASPVYRKTLFAPFSVQWQKAIVFPSDLASLFFLRWVIWMIEWTSKKIRGSPIGDDSTRLNVLIG